MCETSDDSPLYSIVSFGVEFLFPLRFGHLAWRFVNSHDGTNGSILTRFPNENDIPLFYPLAVPPHSVRHGLVGILHSIGKAKLFWNAIEKPVVHVMPRA